MQTAVTTICVVKLGTGKNLISQSSTQLRQGDQGICCLGYLA